MRWWTGSCTYPNAGTGDRPRCREAGIPDTVAFQTKPQLARMILARALDAGYRPRGCVPTGVYGQDRHLRRWLEERDMAHVLAVKCNESLHRRCPASRREAQP